MTHEDRPEKDTPQHIRNMLIEYGGRVPDGRPLWRLVLAQNCRLQCFGVMRHAPKVKDSSELDLRLVEPERVREGEFWVPRYKSKGWILQRWFPPQTWGTKEFWEREKSEDGITRLRGKFPEHGDYFLMAGPWDSIEQAGDLRKPIQMLMREWNNQPTNYERYFRELLRQDHEEQQNAIERYETTLEIYRKTEVLPILKGTSQAAQRVRNQLQQSMGSTAHLGACETWGN